MLDDKEIEEIVCLLNEAILTLEEIRERLDVVNKVQKEAALQILKNVLGFRDRNNDLD